MHKQLIQLKLKAALVPQDVFKKIRLLHLKLLLKIKVKISLLRQIRIRTKQIRQTRIKAKKTKTQLFNSKISPKFKQIRLSNKTNQQNSSNKTRLKLNRLLKIKIHQFNMSLMNPSVLASNLQLINKTKVRIGIYSAF